MSHLLLLLLNTSLAQADPSLSPLGVDADPVMWTSYDRMTGTMAGTAHLEAAMERFADHRRLVHRVLRAHDLPIGLAAVPVVESGYRNLDASHNPVGAAGLWQFIPSTARDYGLRVDEAHDDRLDVRLETEAAARLLSDLHDRFGDWGLALSAYNQGPRKVQSAIDAHGSRDVFALIEAGALSSYPADVLAVVVWMSAEPDPVSR